MMGVCRSWNDQIRGLKSLFTDIAFDTTNSATISTATKFLDLVETQSNDLRVYARCLAWGVDRAVLNTFLSRLRLQSWRFVCFEAEHLSAPFIPYFTLPAPRLLQLIHTQALPEGLFASSFTGLRVLDASVKKHFPWPTATLSNLGVLRLENSRPSRSFCATSIFDLIGRAHRLEELRLTGFLRFSGGFKAKRIPHASLKSIRFVQCNLKCILQHLRFPNATHLRVESYGSGLDGALAPPLSQGAGYFAPLEALPIPVLEQHSVTGVTTHMQNSSANIYFALELKCGAGRTVDFTTTLQKDGDWETYLRSLIDEILRHIRFGPTVNLSISHHPPLSPAHPSPYLPPLSLFDLTFLRLPQVAILRTDYSLVRSVVLHLANPDQGVLPNLKCYSFDTEKQPISMDLMAPEIVACLRSRFSNGSPLALRYWTFDGTAKCGIVISISTNARLFADANQINVTTVLVKRSLPVLAPFLKGMNDGFVGEGGYLISGDLYVERLTLKFQGIQALRTSPFHCDHVVECINYSTTEWTDI